MAGCIANEYIPKESPNFAPHLALQPEFELFNLVYNISRSVPALLTIVMFELIKAANNPHVLLLSASEKRAFAFVPDLVFKDPFRSFEEDSKSFLGIT